MVTFTPAMMVALDQLCTHLRDVFIPIGSPTVWYATVTPVADGWWPVRFDLNGYLAGGHAPDVDLSALTDAGMQVDVAIIGHDPDPAAGMAYAQARVDLTIPTDDGASTVLSRVVYDVQRDWPHAKVDHNLVEIADLMDQVQWAIGRASDRPDPDSPADQVAEWVAGVLHGQGGFRVDRVDGVQIGGEVDMYRVCAHPTTAFTLTITHP